MLNVMEFSKRHKDSFDFSGVRRKKEVHVRTVMALM